MTTPDITAVQAGAQAATQGMNTWNGSVQSIGLLGALVGGVLLLLIVVVLLTLVFLFRQNRVQTEAYTKSTDRLYSMLDHQTVVGAEQNAEWRAAVKDVGDTMKTATGLMAASTETVCANMRSLASSLPGICRHDSMARTRKTDPVQA